MCPIISFQVCNVRMRYYKLPLSTQETEGLDNEQLRKLRQVRNKMAAYAVFFGVTVNRG